VNEALDKARRPYNRLLARNADKAIPAQHAEAPETVPGATCIIITSVYLSRGLLSTSLFPVWKGKSISPVMDYFTKRSEVYPLPY
jgi:hypothetical protein